MHPMSKLPVNWIHGRVAVSFLVKDASNAKEVWEASEGTAIVTLSATQYSDTEQMKQDLQAVLEVVPAVSMALGGGANPDNWATVCMAGQYGAVHLNQPLPTAGYVKGLLNTAEVWVNAAVEPTGEPGVVRVPWNAGVETGYTLPVETVTNILRQTGIDAVKFHPLTGARVYEELAVLSRSAAAAGVEGVEPAGGIMLENVVQVVRTILEAGVTFAIPHIFSAAVDKATGRTRPEYVQAVIQAIRTHVQL